MLWGDLRGKFLNSIFDGGDKFLEVRIFPEKNIHLFKCLHFAVIKNR